MKDDSPDHLRSQELKKRAQEVIPVGTQTFSKSHLYRVGEDAPHFLERGEGAYVYDADGHKYIDYVLGLGPITVGHADERINSAVKQQIDNGVLLSQPQEKEVELSERLCELIPAAEMVRFGKNGSDVTSAAIRLARAYTGRERVAACGYHGWQDWYIASTDRDRGIPDSIKPLTQSWEYNDLESLKELFEEYDDIAAVIMEPMHAEHPDPGFLEGVKQIAHDNGALFIFDEVITGFRFSMGGAQEHFDVVPDLAAFGKGIANGYPLSALVGRKDIMQELEDVFFSFTFGGELASIAAAEATIDVLEEENVIEHMWELGEMLKSGCDELIRKNNLDDYMEIGGLDPWPILEFEGTDADPDNFDLALQSLFQRKVVSNGVTFNGSHFICDHHTSSDIQTTLDTYDKAFENIADAIETGDVYKQLDGDIIRPIFRRQNATTDDKM